VLEVDEVITEDVEESVRLVDVVVVSVVTDAMPRLVFVDDVVLVKVLVADVLVSVTLVLELPHTVPQSSPHQGSFSPVWMH